MPSPVSRTLSTLDRDRQVTTVRHRVASVGGQVEQHLFDLLLIHRDVRVRRGSGERQVNVVREKASEHGPRAQDHLGYVRRPVLEWVRPAEQVQLADERSAASGRTLDGPQLMGYDGRNSGKLVANQGNLSHDDGPQVIEVMRHPAQETPERFHLLGLLELRLQGPSFRHVFDDELGVLTDREAGDANRSR